MKLGLVIYLRCYYVTLFRTLCLANFGEIRATKLAIRAILDLATLSIECLNVYIAPTLRPYVEDRVPKLVWPMPDLPCRWCGQQ